MNKEDLVNLWYDYLGEFPDRPEFGDFMLWLKNNDTRTEANPYIYHQPNRESDTDEYFETYLRQTFTSFFRANPERSTEASIEIALTRAMAMYQARTAPDPHVIGRRQACLTGREWYERFRYQLGMSAGTRTEVVMTAAREAAGLDENGEVV